MGSQTCNGTPEEKSLVSCRAGSMPDQIGWFFEDRRRTCIAPEGIAIGGLLGAHAGRGGKVVRDHVERDAVIVSHHGTVQHTGELSAD